MFLPTVFRIPRLWLVALVAFAAVLVAPSVAAANHSAVHVQLNLSIGADRSSGAVYTQTNTAPINEVVVFHRAPNGTVTERNRVPTGGVGATVTPPFGFPILDSQGGVELTENGRLLFVVNAGSNTISSFRVGPRGGVTLADRESSGGNLPVSVDSHHGVLYVLNELSGTIVGLRYDSRGRLTPIPGSTESLSAPGASGVAGQVGFDRTGRIVTVTLRIPSTIDTFVLGPDDTPGPARSNPSNAPTPFGFAYDPRNTLIVSNAGVVGNPPNPADPAQFVGSGSSYRLGASGMLRALDNEPSNGRATCWVVITGNGKYAFMTNTLSSSVSRFRIDGGNLTLLGTTPTTSAGAAADLALSRDSRYLYVLSPLEPITGPTAASMDVYRVGADGSLTHIQSTPSNLPVGTSGLAAS